MTPMMNSDPKTHPAQDAQHTDQLSWLQLLENIRVLATRKTERMLGNGEADEDAFDRDARHLRTLMGSAEISARLKTQDEKEESLDGEERPPREHTEEELDEIFERVRARVERVATEERKRLGLDVEEDSARGDGRNRGAESRKDLA